MIIYELDLKTGHVSQREETEAEAKHRAEEYQVELARQNDPGQLRREACRAAYSLEDAVEAILDYLEDKPEKLEALQVLRRAIKQQYPINDRG